MIFALVAQRRTETNLALASRSWSGAESLILTPQEALERLDAGAVALGRLDASRRGRCRRRPSSSAACRRAACVLTRLRTLFAAHDKLLTAREFFQAGVLYPATTIFTAADETLPLAPPVVIKPRLRELGADVFR